MWFFKPNIYLAQWPVEIHVIDVGKQRIYFYEGSHTEAEALVRQALDDFRAGREP